MIQENEIMCGNYFIHNDNWSSREHKGIFQFDSQHFFELHECTFSLENIEPIPLTEDILIRCGFENDIAFEGMVLDCENGCSIGISTSENVCYFRGNIEPFWVDIVPEIAYLHQMQNLVKLLCNQTIELK